MRAQVVEPCKGKILLNEISMRILLEYEKPATADNADFFYIGWGGMMDGLKTVNPVGFIKKNCAHISGRINSESLLAVTLLLLYCI
jgi:hypothetical protein